MKIRHILLAATVLTIASCAKEGMERDVVVPGEAIQMASFRQQVFTRADVDEIDFPAGTKYTLLAVDAAQPTKWSSAAGFENVPQEGVEAVANGVHKISYNPIGLYRHGESLDFYGVTYGKAGVDAPVLNAVSDGVDPTITIGETDGLLPDLMHSNETKGKSSADGIVQLPFEHALAALNFIISKQDESFDQVQDKQLQHVKVTKVVLKNVAKQATMDVVTGVWTPEAASERVVYEDAAGKNILVEAKAIGPKDMLVFPTYGEQVSVEVSLEGLELYNGTDYVPMNKTFDATGLVVTDGKCTVTYDLKLFDDVTGDVAGNLKFERNHKYQLAIFVMRDNVRIVAVSPQVYEWVDVNLDLVSDPRVTTLGQPITFGGTVWMDRNLGAKSADCEKDWWHTLGYYWEYGRNIPFIVDVDVIKKYNYGIPDKYSNGSLNSRHNLCDPNGNQIQMNENANPSWPHYLIYTWDNNGNKVSKVNLSKTLLELKATGTAPDGDYLAIEPGDKGSYAYTAVSGKYWYGPSGSTEAVTWLKDRWEYLSDGTHRPKVENQPVPKGWRLPNAKDVYSIMPEETLDWQAPDNTQRFVEVGVLNGPYSTYNRASNNGTQVVDLVTPTNNGPTNAYKYVGDYKYQFFYGNIDVRKNATGNFSTPIRGRWDQTLLFGIKHQGTPQAYRYKIEMLESNVHNGWFVRFTQYPTSSTDKFEAQDTNNDGKPDTWNLHKFDWDHPSAYLDFPMSGEIYPSTYHFLGSILKLRLQNYLDESNNYCMKLSNQGTGFMATYHITTGPTRLVRDLEAN